jgi:DNA-binding response OmpR family regulator
MMPEIDGWGTCARLRQLSDVPILMLSALGGDRHIVRGLKCGADDYMSKPFADDVLIARVEALLRRATVSSVPAR